MGRYLRILEPYDRLEALSLGLVSSEQRCLVSLSIA